MLKETHDNNSLHQNKLIMGNFHYQNQLGIQLLWEKKADLQNKYRTYHDTNNWLTQCWYFLSLIYAGITLFKTKQFTQKA